VSRCGTLVALHYSDNEQHARKRREDAAMKLDKIVIPLDGSVLAESALWKAVELTRDQPTTIVLVRAAEAFTLPGADPTEAQVNVVREAEEYLEAAAERVRKAGGGHVETAVWYGPPAPAIVEAARIGKADLIVMSTHGRSGLGRLILGSVAESVLRSATTPILLLRAPGAPVEELKGSAEARPAEKASV
jgi:nucleotide-binding universal stress UspA family protein